MVAVAPRLGGGGVARISIGYQSYQIFQLVAPWVHASCPPPKPISAVIGTPLGGGIWLRLRSSRVKGQKSCTRHLLGGRIDCCMAALDPGCYRRKCSMSAHLRILVRLDMDLVG